jgi:hypothetical protein
VQLTPRHSPQVCTHERGVGTTVCLHCRKEARVAAQDRRRRLMLRGAAGAIVVATGLAATALGATALRDKNLAKRGDSARSRETARVVTDSGAKTASPTATTPTAPTVAVVPNSNDAAGAPPSVPTTKPIVAKPAPVPTIQMGNSSLDGGISAERTDSVITLSFDMPMTRTRRPEKFEQFVRATLPSIYGKKIDSVLTTMPPGSLAKQGDLFSELPSRGMRIPVDSAWEIRVFPETRKGHDGPLVIRYRASAVAR